MPAAAGCRLGCKGQFKTRRATVATVVEVADEDSGTHSIVHIKTRDRPGLLTDIVKVLKDINVNVVSAEVRRRQPRCICGHPLGKRATPELCPHRAWSSAPLCRRA